MMNSDQTQFAAYKIEDWIIQPNRNRLVRDGEEIKLEPKHMKVLLCLIDHHGNTVSKDALIANVWPEVVVTEHSLNQAISKLRRIFGDDPKHPRIIETISKKGYRLISPGEKILTEEETTHKKATGNGKSIPTSQRPIFHHSHLQNGNRRYIFMPVLFILIISIGAMIWPKAPRHIDSSTKLAQLTSLPGIERYPAYSPDDRRLAYVHYNPSAKKTNVLKLLDLSNHTTLELCEAAAIHFPSFSPDGKTIAFASMGNCESAIHTVPTTGGTATKLLSGFSDQIKGLDWSPIGSRLVYADRAAKDEPFALFLFSLDTQRRAQLTAPDKKNLGDKLPAFSPDGKSIAFARVEASKSADIYILNTDLGEQKRLTHENAPILGLDWLADGKHIIYCSDDDTECRLMQVSVEEGTAKKIYSSLEYAGVNLTSSTLSNHIAFEYAVYHTGIYKKHFDSNTIKASPAEIFSPTTRSNWFPQYSPDGQTIAFLSDRSGHSEIWLCDAEGKNLRKLMTMTLSSPNAPPRWSPDGRRILFDKKTERINQVFMVDLNGGNSKLLATDAVAPVFSRDGQWVYFSSRRTGQWQIWKIPLAGGEAVQVTAKGGYVGFESTDGSELYFSKYDQPGIWKRSSQNEETQVVMPLASQDTFNWQLAENGIYFVNRMIKNDIPVLCFFDFATGAIHERDDFLQKLDSRMSGICLSPNRKTILFSHVERVDIDLVGIGELAR